MAADFRSRGRSGRNAVARAIGAGCDAARRAARHLARRPLAPLRQARAHRRHPARDPRRQDQGAAPLARIPAVSAVNRSVFYALVGLGLAVRLWMLTHYWLVSGGDVD